jgi:hypothetical protein
MQTVVETPNFIKAAKSSGMSDDEVRALVNTLASDSEAGEMIVGTGGFRKLRVAGRGKGKSGGYRVITFYSGTEIPVFLIDVFSKGDKANLSHAERNALNAVGKQIVAAYATKVSVLRRSR